MRIERDDVTRPAVLALLEEHVQNMRTITPAEHVFALDATQLRAADVTFWTLWDGDELLGCGALKELSPTQGEVKSMRTPSQHRRRGAARTMLTHIIAEAQRRGYGELLLETGSQPEFVPAHQLYESAGFVRCGPYGDYAVNGSSVFMRLALDAARSVRVTNLETRARQ
jgi:putative acetyltransferase